MGLLQVHCQSRQQLTPCRPACTTILPSLASSALYLGYGSDDRIVLIASAMELRIGRLFISAPDC